MTINIKECSDYDFHKIISSLDKEIEREFELFQSSDSDFKQQLHKDNMERIDKQRCSLVYQREEVLNGKKKNV